MKQSESQFVRVLQQKAKRQAAIEASSPLPQIVRPLAAIVGMHYWQVLLLLSFLISIPVSIWFFPAVFARVMGTSV